MVSTALLFILMIGTSHGLETRDFTRSGDRKDNPFLLDRLRSSTLGEALEVVSGLEEREDRYVQDILLGLHRERGSRMLSEAEYLMLRILEAVLFRSDGQDRAAREENRQAILSLAGDLEQIRDPTLRTRLLSTLSTLRTEPGIVALLMRTGSRLSQEHRRDSGMVPPDREEEIIMFFHAALAHPAAPLGDICLDLVRYSRMKRIVDAGRRTARQLLQIP